MMALQTFTKEPGLFWEVVTWTGTEQGLRVEERSSGGAWPNRKWVSVPAMLINQVHEHQKLLDQQVYYTKSGKLRRPKGE